VDGKFRVYLEAHGVSFAGLPDYSTLPDGKTIIPIDPLPKKKGRSKMKKWSCDCTNIRAAVEVEATCNKCSNTFKLQD